jgi:triphosphoribosyl-dephospho-coA synthetase
VTGRELDGATYRQLRALEPRNTETVAKHLVMAGRYLDIDPEFALAHAVAASRSAGRIAAVREAVGIAAYVAEDYELALRELRTHRRISGSVDHLALLVDCERALGRLPKAQEMIAEFKREELPAEVRVELAIVESGILTDQGKKSQAVVALQIPQLNPKRAFEYSPRLFSAYADALANAGRDQEAERWARLSVVAEAALGQGNFAEPEIFDIFGEADLFEKEETPAERPVKAADEEASEKAEATGSEENTSEDSAAEAPEDSEAEEKAEADVE